MLLLIAIKDNLISSSLISLFNTQYQVLQILNGDRKSFLFQAHIDKPTLIIADLYFLNSVNGIKNIQRRSEQSKIILYTDKPDLIHQMIFIKAGLDGFIFPSMENSEINSVVKHIIAKGFDIPKESMGYLLKLFRSDSQTIHPEKSINATPKQLEILKLICRGIAAYDIANHLNIAISTFNTHKKQLYKITGTHNLKDLREFGIKFGFGYSRSDYLNWPPDFWSYD